MDALDKVITDGGADAYVIFASSKDADMRYLTGFTTSDPFVFFKKKGERGVMIVSQMEYARAVREGKTAVMTRTAAKLPEILKNEPDLLKATARMIAGQVSGKILVPPAFPLGLARPLEEECTLIIDVNGLAAIRAVKTRSEIRMIRYVQECTERAIDKGISMIRKSRVKNGVLYLDKVPLTSERVRAEMHILLTGLGCSATDTIVACGKDTAVPHITGSGPLLADEPIVLDIFPHDERTGYYSDMTRTVVKGEPSPEIREMHAAVMGAQDLAVSQIRNGAVGADIHKKVIGFFSELGYENGTRGFIHNLGHGIGLEVHEAPSLGPNGKELASGNIVTIEPGLYYPKTGGVRLEDIGAVTGRGFSRFTNYPKDLVV